MATILAVSVMYFPWQSESNHRYRGQITGWAGIIRVDNSSYTWLGSPAGPTLVNQTAFTYTSTSSVFTMNVDGKVEMTIKFLSPITPNDYMRQSLVFSYMDVSVQSLDGAEHAVELYSDISAGGFSYVFQFHDT